MHLPMKNPTNYTLIDGYSPVGDMIVFFLCVLIFLLLMETFLKRSKALHLFQLCTGLLCLAAIANTGFYYVAIHQDLDWLLILLRAIHHVSLLLIFGIYFAYLSVLIALPDRYTKRLLFVSNTLCAVSGIADVLCPILGFAFYRDAAGEWQTSMQHQPFSIAYVIYCIILFTMMIRFRKRFPQHLLHMLLITGSFSFVLAAVGSYQGHNPFLTLSFLLPILVVLYMIHANTYSVKTGAMNTTAFDEYLSLQNDRPQGNYYMCLRFDTDAEFRMPDELGKLFYNFWNHYFKKALLFRPTTELFVLTIRTNDSDETAKRALALYHDVFLKHYGTYGVPYRIVFFDHLDFCKNLEQFYEIFHFFAEETAPNSCKVCTAEDYARYQEIKYLSAQLKDIYDNGTLDDPRVLVYCQPVYNVASGKFNTAEALMRLTLEETGMVFPDRFIPLAERLGYIHKLSMIILNKTCREIRRLREEGYTISRISVNLSMQELSSDTFMDEFCSIVQQNHIDFSSIAVELTESRNDTEYATLLDRVNQFKQLGVGTYLDDFGTGYSNFDRILSLKLGVVKFDRSLLLMTEEDANARFLLDYFSTAFEKLGYQVLYEGVETADQQALCIKSHADYLQGYRFSKPIPIEQLRKFL